MERNALASCTLCPRSCKADRLHGETGFCRAGQTIKAARAALHFWEEPCLSGARGSGTIFFSHCTLQCVFCQNREISARQTGAPVTISRFAQICLELQEQGAHNINLVTPTHFVPQITQGISLARKRGLVLPVVYNSGGYETPETVQELRGTVDVFLPDFKYWDNRLARKYSGAPDYREWAQKSLAQMVKQTGSPQFDQEGMLRRGVIVRHLMLPGMMEDSKAIIRYLHETYGEQIILSIMNQYTPMEFVRYYPEINRTVNQEEYDGLLDFAISIGVETAYVQEQGTQKESFIPPFDRRGL